MHQTPFLLYKILQREMSVWRVMFALIKLQFNG